MKQMYFNTVAACMLVFLTNPSLKAEEKAPILQKFFQLVDAGDFENAGMYLSDDIVVSIPFSPVPLDKMAYKNIGMAMKMAFNDMKHTMTAILEDGNKIMYKAVFTGTNTGPLMGAQPTGNKVTSPFMGYCLFDDRGKIAQMELIFDVVGFNSQLAPATIAEMEMVKITEDFLKAANTGNFTQLTSLIIGEKKHSINGKWHTKEELLDRVSRVNSTYPKINRSLTKHWFNGSTLLIQGKVDGLNSATSTNSTEKSQDETTMLFSGAFQFSNSGKIEQIELIMANVEW